MKNNEEIIAAELRQERKRKRESEREEEKKGGVGHRIRLRVSVPRPTCAAPTIVIAATFNSFPGGREIFNYRRKNNLITFLIIHGGRSRETREGHSPVRGRASPDEFSGPGRPVPRANLKPDVLTRLSEADLASQGNLIRGLLEVTEANKSKARASFKYADEIFDKVSSSLTKIYRNVAPLKKKRKRKEKE